MRDDVQKMLGTDGLYIAIDPAWGNQALVPIASKGGKLFSMKIDAEILPGEFFDRTTLHGPFWPDDSNILQR